MPQVAIIGIKARLICSCETDESLTEAYAAAGLSCGQVDFGTIGPRYSIIVYEFGLMHGAQDAYFRLGKQLYNGNAILLHTDEEGETIDFPQDVIKHLNECKEVEFFSSIEEVENAIAAGRVIRPQTAINGIPVWQWNRQ